MTTRRRLLSSDQMTSQERLEGLIELLANGMTRVVKDKPADSTKTASTQSAFIKPRILQRKGRIPFGQSKTEEGRTANQAEEYWIAQIIRMSVEAFSSEQIARRLNQEDTLSQRAGQWSRTAVWRILQYLKQTGVTK